MFKFNNDRKSKYRIQTVIYNGENGRIVRKKGLTPEAQVHLEQMCSNRNLLQQIYPECTFCDANIGDEGVCFEYLEGECYSEQYELAIKRKDKELFKALLKRQAEIILSCNETNKSIFNETPEFIKIFGNGSAFKGQRALNIVNFEFTSHNMLLNSKYGKCGVIDYEYVFDFPVPVDLLLYHCVIKTNMWTITGFSELLTVQEMLEILNISTSFENLEKSWTLFDQHYGRSEIAEAKLKYIKNKDNISELKNKTQIMQQEIVGNKNYINILTENLGKQQEYIKTLSENLKEQQNYIEAQKLDIVAKNCNLLKAQQEIARKQDIITQKEAERLHLNALHMIDEERIRKGELQCENLQQALQDEIQKKLNEQEIMQTQIDMVRNELQSLKSSLCWRMTALVRKGMDIFRKNS